MFNIRSRKCDHVTLDNSNDFKVIQISTILFSNATYAVAKRKPERIRLAGIRTLTSVIPVQRSN